MSLIRISEEAVRRTAERIRRDADRLAPRPYAKGGILRNTINGELFVPVERACSLVVSTQEPANPKPGDRWINSMTGEQHVFRPLGVTTAEASVALKVALGGCPHKSPEPVVLTTGEVVAAVCPDCLQPLPPSFVGSTWKP